MQPRGLDDRKVPQVDAVGANVAQPRREGAEVGAELSRGVELKTGVRIEPAGGRALALGQRDVVDVSHKQDVAPGERRPALPRVDALELPSAEERLRNQG